IFAVAVLAAVIVAVVRRAVVRPPRMHIAPEGYVILGLISFLMLTLLVFESAGIAAGQLETGVTPPPLAGFLKDVYAGDSSAALFAGAWWAHVVTILAFAVYLPRTKHLHIVTTLPNVYFRSSRPRGALQLIDDIENKETFGAANIRDFSWKQLRGVRRSVPGDDRAHRQDRRHAALAHADGRGRAAGSAARDDEHRARRESVGRAARDAGRLGAGARDPYFRREARRRIPVFRR